VTIGRQESQRETFARLYDEYMPKVYRYIYYRVNDTPVCEDLTSSVFEKALVNFGRYSSDKASFSTWLFSIARNVLIDHYRARRPAAPLEAAADVPSQAPSPWETAERREEMRRLNQCLAALAAEDQEIVRLKFAGELNNRQIARITGLSESNVGTRLFRAIRKLRASFGELADG